MEPLILYRELSYNHVFNSLVYHSPDLFYSLLSQTARILNLKIKFEDLQMIVYGHNTSNSVHYWNFDIGNALIVDENRSCKKRDFESYLISGVIAIISDPNDFSIIRTDLNFFLEEIEIYRKLTFEDLHFMIRTTIQQNKLEILLFLIQYISVLKYFRIYQQVLQMSDEYLTISCIFKHSSFVDYFSQNVSTTNIHLSHSLYCDTKSIDYTEHEKSINLVLKNYQDTPSERIFNFMASYGAPTNIKRFKDMIINTHLMYFFEYLLKRDRYDQCELLLDDLISLNNPIKMEYLLQKSYVLNLDLFKKFMNKYLEVSTDLSVMYWIKYLSITDNCSDLLYKIIQKYSNQIIKIPIKGYKCRHIIYLYNKGISKNMLVELYERRKVDFYIKKCDDFKKAINEIDLPKDVIRYKILDFLF